MKFLIVSHALHSTKDGMYYAYEPYVREINLWLKYVEKVAIVAPLVPHSESKITSVYKHHSINFNKIPSISIISFSEVLRAIFFIPSILLSLFREMNKADHIHLRCPGTIGLLGCIVQVFFPKKKKTVKYAGNWDPNAKQPRSYRFQKWILNHTFFTKNCTVLVYGQWPDQSKNIKSFFTASYSEKMIGNKLSKHFEEPFSFLFIGSLVAGKRPLYALKLVEGLHKKGIKCKLAMYGDGSEKKNIETYIEKNKLETVCTLHGNQDAITIQNAYKKSHFLILPSKSEGWPKVVAEAMFWGAVPVVTKISCVPWMLGNDKRGILISGNLKEDVLQIESYIHNENLLRRMSSEGQLWSQKYTLEFFENQIKKLLV